MYCKEIENRKKVSKEMEENLIKTMKQKNLKNCLSFNTSKICR